MAKPNEASTTDEHTVIEPTPEFSTFRDTVYTSRVLIVPETGRALAVAMGQVQVKTTDVEAITFLKSHPDLQPLKE
ncbi:hypothetical protein [Pseudomonas moorei]|uniref:hypothetical protein n=1 Tax=Pseudomonas moorei TaxID=395599 RepID=UPI0036F2BC75